MSYVEKLLKCLDCGVTFTFTAGEQEFFATKGLTNEPKRCVSCRKTKKQQTGNSAYSSHSYGTR